MESIGSYEDISSLNEWDKNPRHNQAAIDKVAQSIKRFGFASPIIVRTQSRTIICGHTRFLAAQQLGLTQVPVRFMDLDPVEAELLALADNRIGEVADWNNEMLSDILKEHQEHNLSNLGFSDQELRSFLEIELETEDYISSDNQELDLEGFQEFQHKCPRCDFEFNQ